MADINTGLIAIGAALSVGISAIAAGIAASGWSGNVMTSKYGASIYLSAVVTDAVLESDPANTCVTAPKFSTSRR